MIDKKIKEMAEKNLDNMIAIRRELHQCPELGFEEEKTTTIIKRELNKIGIPYVDKVAKTEAHFDYQIRPEHPMSKVLVKLKNELRKLGDEMVSVAKANNISLSTDDVTDPEETKL